MHRRYKHLSESVTSLKRNLGIIQWDVDEWVYSTSIQSLSFYTLNYPAQVLYLAPFLGFPVDA